MGTSGDIPDLPITIAEARSIRNTARRVNPLRGEDPFGKSFTLHSGVAGKYQGSLTSGRDANMIGVAA